MFSSFNGLEPSLRFGHFVGNWEKSKLSSLFKKCLEKNKNGLVDNVICNSAKNGLMPQRDFFDKDIANTENTNGYYIIQENDFVYNPRKSNEAPYGPISMYKYKDKGIVSPLYLCFRATKEIHPRYFEMYFKSSVWHKYIYFAGDSGARYDRVSIKDDVFFEMPINIPSLPEQQKIADFLSLVDRRIEKQRQLIESLKKYKRGLFSYYFQKNKSYKIARLGDFAKIYQPSTISQSQFNDGKYKVFGANGYIGNYDKYNHAVPQVTISCRGEKCGTVNFVDAYTWITGNSMVVNIDDQNEINKRYLYHCLSNQNLKYLVSGSAQPQIIRTDVARHSIPVPSIEFQEKLSFFLDSIEQKIKNEQTMEECLFDMKNALLQQMFI